MMVNILFITIVAYLKVVNSQYYGSPAPNSYQPYNYYPSAPASTASPSMYAPTFAPPAIPAYFPTSTFSQPPSFAPPFYSGPFSPMTGSIPIPAPASNNALMPIFTSLPTYPPPMYVSPNPYATAAPVSNLATTPANPPKYSTVASKPTAPAPICTPSTAVAYYLTTPLESPKAVTMTEKVKEIVQEKLPPPTYPCPFCTGFANVPKNPKVLPPPPCSSVLPDILDKIPTIKIPDVLKIKDLSKFAKPTPLLAELFEHKLSGKLRFDEDVLDGFLTGLGLGKCNDS